MIVRSVSLRREGDFGWANRAPDQTKPFIATLEVQGISGKVELALSPDLSRRIVEIVAEEIAAAGRATAEALTAEAFNAVALPAPEAA